MRNVLCLSLAAMVGALCSGCFVGGGPPDRAFFVEVTNTMASQQCADDDTWEQCIVKLRRVYGINTDASKKTSPPASSPSSAK